MPHSWPDRHFLDFVLEALERLELAFVDDDVVADQATPAPRSTLPSVTRQPATLPTLVMLKTSRISALPRKVSRRSGEQARHRRFHVIHEIVDDVVVADFDAGALGRRACLLARTLKPMIAAPEAAASVTSDSVMPPTPECTMRAGLRRCRACRARRDGFDRALHVALDDQREFLAPAGDLELAHHLLERAACRRGRRPLSRACAGGIR
jgi:hypothetical protein